VLHVKCFFLVSLILTVSIANVQAQETCTPIKLKPVGKTFKIAERDLLEVIKEQLAQVDWQALNRQMKEKILAYKPLNSVELRPATEHRVRYHDPTFILPFDIKDAEGNVLYARGTSINPLDAVPESVWKNRVYVFFNLADRCQRAFVKDFVKKNSTQRLVTLVADGHSTLKDITDFIKELLFPVYSATSLMAERFGVEKTLSLVTFVKKDGKSLVRIEEIPDKLIRERLKEECSE
jgi:hypothetical protein